MFTRSLVLSVAALGCVVLSFPTTWFVYAGIYRIHFMGIFNFIALFVIVGIGVDDVFVFHDAWKQAAALHPDDLEARLGYAYRRSVSAMAVTTVTDAAAFFTNCLSSITVVRVFGVFMGTLVLVNFFLVVTAFPALIVVRYHLGLDATAARSCFLNLQRTLAPGGVTEMALVALSLSANPAFVTLHHIYRILLTVLVIGTATKLRNRRRAAPPDG